MGCYDNAGYACWKYAGYTTEETDCEGLLQASYYYIDNHDNIP